MRTPRTPFALALVALLMSCGGGGSTTPSHVLKIEKWPPSGDNQTDTVGRVLPKVLRVKVTLDGNVVAGYMVHFSGANLGTDSVLSDSNGIATSSWTLGPIPGTQFATVTLDSAEGSPLIFKATGVPGAATQLIKVSGDSQVATLGHSFPAQVVVQVADQYGNGVVGKWVYWTDSGRVVLGADSIISGDDGRIALNVLNSTSTGTTHIVATAKDPLAGSPVVFFETIQPAPPPAPRTATYIQSSPRAESSGTLRPR